MSLTKQLWLAIVLVLIVALGGTFVISTLSARNYLQQQLYLKNQDNVSSLALSISQLDKDLATLELLISAQFDSGHYQYIRIKDPAGKVMVERKNPPLPLEVPQWFQKMIPFDIEAGIAPIQNGWNVYGTLELQSHSRFAYQSLWQQTRQLLGWFMTGLLLCGALGSLILKVITKPLHEVINQAEAIGNNQFIRIVEPKTREFRAVVSAMNRLSGRIQQTLAEEAGRLEQLRLEVHYDHTTGLLNRKQFINQLKAALASDDANASGTLLIARFSELDMLNQALGRPIVDDILHQMGQLLLGIGQNQPGWVAGRLNGSDLSLLACGTTDADEANTIAQQIAKSLQTILDKIDHDGERLLPIGATLFEPGEELSAILARTDNALVAAAQKGATAVHITRREGYTISLTDRTAWRSALTTALEQNQISVGQYPVVNMNGDLLHMEAPARVLIDGDWRHAGLVIPSVAQNGLLPLFDQCVVQTALDKIQQTGLPQGVNLSHQAISDPEFCRTLQQWLKEKPVIATKLWLEIPEYGAYRQLEEFKRFCRQLKPLKCKIGLEHVGSQFVRISELHDLGLDYIKVDAALIRDIDQNAANQAILRNLCTIAHTIGLTVIAEGVENKREMAALPEFGLDGMTGPAITKHHTAHPDQA
ncbi:MAG: EAL domain-containing protein [Desulfuromonas sp.]|nr:EAL domain-containing protein [Desulfuromonas sp.]